MTPEEQKAFDEMKAANEKLAADLEAAKKKPADDDADDDKKKKSDDADDLVTQAAKKKASDEEHAAQVKRIESATRFSLGLDRFLTDHKNFLPSEIGEIVKLADKENYDTTEMKANATKAAIVKSFFSVQENVDLLTPSQKDLLDGFLKLTKTGREEKAPDVYENIFEPTLEMMKRVRKAEEVGKANSGFANESDVSAGYKARLISRSRQVHLGEKEK